MDMYDVSNASNRGETMTTTKHNCGGPVFGRKTEGCPRCDELLAGAAPVVWHKNERLTVDELRAHNCKVSQCAMICTFGDW
jgi:hypothetical protein